MLKNNNSIDEILKELTKIVSNLEQKDLPLDEAVKKFKEGIEYVEQGKKILDEVNKLIVEIDNSKE
ncbi:MAG: exodeoxyribonuclease VII small subunit [Metamycoplasmataceae bacterium]|uniref:exodeoxyribonuclease VII small subunit n=1 Tax=Mycoplasmopsis lipophila TaxID=2117 RepID=UPI0038734A5A